MSAPAEDQEPEAICMGCNNVIEEGSVVAFGESLFHLEWYALAFFSVQILDKLASLFPLIS
jgi:hypothetical protein